MTSELKVFAPAKVNLALHITGQREDGYHLLDSLVMFADVGDEMVLTPAEALSITVTGPFAKGVPTDARNLVWRAAELAGWTGHIALHKALPNGAGIGGGSSDAAGLLRAVGSQIRGLDLGADVPVCLMGRAARMQGIGEQVTLWDRVPEFDAVLLNPGAHVPTPQIFKALTSKVNSPLADGPGVTACKAEWMSWLTAARNDLQDPAVAAAPEIALSLAALQATHGAQLVRMSGSGATCFALYPDAPTARAAAEALHQKFPKWWCVPVRLS